MSEDAMTDVENPFGDEKQDKAAAKKIKPPVNWELLIRRLAEIEDELSSRGVDPLTKERDALRKALKDSMTDAGADKAYDETSNHEAVLVQRFSDSWDVDALKAMLSPQQLYRYVAESVAVGAVGDGVKNGDLSRGELESRGAVAKVPGARALYIRERKETDDGLRG